MNIALGRLPAAIHDTRFSLHGAAVNSRLKTFVINLDRSEDRWVSMAGKLSHLGIAYERVSAVDGRLLQFPVKEYSEFGYRLLHGKRTNPAEVGCYLSHLECAKRLLETDAAHALILEDDLQFPEDFCEMLAAALDACQTWDILRLSTVNKGRKFAFRQITGKRALAIALTREKGSGAYVINRRAARWLVDAHIPIRLPYDIAYDLEFLAGLRAVFITPVPVSQESHFPTQIQQGRRQYRMSNWLRITVYLYRAWLELCRFNCRLFQLVNAKWQWRVAKKYHR
jgi:glycosyl transferase family 25